MKIWSLAKQLAAETPAERNRYVDFLRAVSITVVIIGHWLIATAWVTDAGIETGQLLEQQPQTQWLTWIFQVMPIFFIVGGYSNAVSLESAARKGTRYAGWLAARLNRLLSPLLLLLVSWGVLAVLMTLGGVSKTAIQHLSQAALIPTWFLAIYIAVVLLAPLTWRFWRRSGFISVLLFAGDAALVDLLFFAAGQTWLGWSNYFWVWLAVHQLGYAWRENRVGGPVVLLSAAAVALTVLYLLIHWGPYPMAMVGSPDPGLSNTLPPKVTLIALGVMQFGVLLALQGPMQRLLAGIRTWAATVLINSMIMTVYLWHITVMIGLGALLYYSGGIGLGIEPGTTAWWASRPVWVAALIVLLVPVALLLSPFERKGLASQPTGALYQVVGAVLACLGIAALALFGYRGEVFPYSDLVALLLVVAGALLSGLRLRPNRSQS